MVLLGFCIRRDRRGIQIAFRIGRWEKSIYPKRYPAPLHRKAPRLPDTAILTEIPKGKVIEPEDIINGTAELDKPLEPDEVGNVKL